MTSVAETAHMAPPTGNRPNAESALNALGMLLAFHGIRADLAQLAHEFGSGVAGFGELELIRAARRVGLKSKSLLTQLARLPATPLPAIAEARDGRFFILAKVANNKALIQHPGRPPEELGYEAL